MNCGIYTITCVVNGIVYVGQSSNIPRRWRAHRGALGRGTHANAHLQHSWNKYGPESFHFDIAQECLPAQLDDAEISFIRNTKEVHGSKCVNVCMGAMPNGRGKSMASEARSKISAYAKNRSAEHRAHLKGCQAGRPKSKESCARMSIAQKARYAKEPMHHSAETRAKIAATLMGHSVSPEARAKIGASNKLRVCSEETRKRMVVAQEKRRRREAQHTMPASAQSGIRP